MPKPNTDHTDERDINDIFDSIVLTEENLVQQGYDEGYADGVAAGNTEGYHLGYHRGAELGAELGYYSGIAEIYLKTKQTEKADTALINLTTSLDAFPKTNDENYDILELANQIRAQFKKTCAILKISGRYPEADTLSF